MWHGYPLVKHFGETLLYFIWRPDFFLQSRNLQVPPVLWAGCNFNFTVAQFLSQRGCSEPEMFFSVNWKVKVSHWLKQSHSQGFLCMGSRCSIFSMALILRVSSLWLPGDLDAPSSPLKDPSAFSRLRFFLWKATKANWTAAQPDRRMHSPGAQVWLVHRKPKSSFAAEQTCCFYCQGFCNITWEMFVLFLPDKIDGFWPVFFEGEWMNEQQQEKPPQACKGEHKNE